MADELNGYFSAVFRWKNITTLLNFSWINHIALASSPETVAKKVTSMQDTKSPRVDVIPARLHKETLKKRSTPNAFLREEVRLHWKEATTPPF